VVNATGVESVWPRAQLRHRVLVTRAFVGITGDKDHDSYAMQHFCNRMMQTLHKESVLATQHITRFHVHSDNAAAHFKSSKSLDSLTQHLGTVAQELSEERLCQEVGALTAQAPGKISFSDGDGDRISFEPNVREAGGAESNSFKMKVGNEIVLEDVTALEVNLLTGTLRDAESSLVLPLERRQELIQQLQVMCRWAGFDLAFKEKDQSIWASISSVWWSFGCPGHGKGVTSSPCAPPLEPPFPTLLTAFSPRPTATLPHTCAAAPVRGPLAVCRCGMV
jgi:hypothetical protein